MPHNKTAYKTCKLSYTSFSNDPFRNINAKQITGRVIVELHAKCSFTSA